MIRKCSIGLISLLTLASAFGCEERAGELEEEAKPEGMAPGEEPTVGEPTAGETETGRAEQQTQREQGEVIAILQASNRGEIEAARYAEENATNDELKELAERIRGQHEEALEEENELVSEMNIQPARQAQQVQQLEQSHRTMMQELRGVSGAELDRKYVQSQIQAHQQTLNDIDRRLMPMASGELESHLRELRGHVQEHLSSLQEIQPKLQEGEGQRGQAEQRGQRPQGQRPQQQQQQQGGTQY